MSPPAALQNPLQKQAGSINPKELQLQWSRCTQEQAQRGGKSTGGKTGGLASVETHGEQMRNGGLVGGLVGGRTERLEARVEEGQKVPPQPRGRWRSQHQVRGRRKSGGGRRALLQLTAEAGTGANRPGRSTWYSA
jgi:hypothetical protein